MFETERRLFKDHGGLILAGFLLVFFSVFGQSVFFGCYLPFIQDDLNLTKTDTGSLYMMATILSSIVIIFTGKILDHTPLRLFIVFTMAGLAIGCFVMAGAQNSLMLFAAFFILRQFGQGLTVLSATTSINRYLETNRGKAQALIMLGGAIHLMVFPFIALSLESHIDWRQAWVFYGLFVLFVLLPGFWFYLRNHQSKTHALWEKRTKEAAESVVDAIGNDWTRKNVLMHWRFYMMVVIFVLAPFVGTAVVFFQRDIADSLGISPIAYAATFPVFSAMTILFSLLSGYVIDKYGEMPVLTAFPIVYAVGLFLLTSSNANPAIYYPGMALIGVGNGMISSIGGPLLVSLYGTKHLAAIKSLFFSISILSSALSPYLFGMMMDKGVDVLTLLSWTAWYSAVVWILAPIICYKKAA